MRNTRCPWKHLIKQALLTKDLEDVCRNKIFLGAKYAWEFMFFNKNNNNYNNNYVFVLLWKQNVWIRWPLWLLVRSEINCNWCSPTFEEWSSLKLTSNRINIRTQAFIPPMCSRVLAFCLKQRFKCLWSNVKERDMWFEQKNKKLDYCCFCCLSRGTAATLHLSLFLFLFFPWKAGFGNSLDSLSSPPPPPAFTSGSAEFGCS